MTHELKDIIFQAVENQQKGLKSVLATVVDLDGSSYRKPGVRMLICEDGTSTGSVSGGCVEKEIINRSHSVFKSDEPKIITYDGRYRLGCEGILYILIEPIFISETFLHKFKSILKDRKHFKIESSFINEDNAVGNFGSKIIFNDDKTFTLNENFSLENFEHNKKFVQSLKPIFKLIIIGGEHDAVKLCAMANLLGWEVEVITSLKDPKKLSDFPGAKSVSAESPEMIDFDIDDETAIVLMTHNYAVDLKYLLKLQTISIDYIGILGSAKRREEILNELIEFSPDISEKFLESIYSPAGLDIGAITPEEIALSILSEILAVTRNKKASELRNINGKIHQTN